MIGLGLGLTLARAGGWTPASLPAGRVLRWHVARSLSALRAAGDGTGGAPVSGGTVGWWPDQSAAADAARQASSGLRPVVRTHAKGRGVAVDGTGQVGTGGAYLAGASSVTGVKYTYAVLTVVGPDTTRGSGAAPGGLFADGYHGFVGTSPVDTSALLVTGDNGTNNFMAAQLDQYTRDGTVILVAAADAGYGRMRYVVRVRHGTTASAGALQLLRAFGGYDGYYGRGSVHEVIALSNAVTSPELARIDEYLAAYWTAGALIVVAGDSLMAGYGLTESQGPAALLHESYERGIPCPCIAIPGQGISASVIGVTPTMLTDDSAKLTALKRRHSPMVVVALAGTNDLSVSRTAAQVYADIQTYCAMVQALGAKVIVGTIAARADAPWTGAMETQRGLYNGLLRASHAFADGLVDVDVINPPRQGDSVHWTAPGTVSVTTGPGGARDAVDALI